MPSHYIDDWIARFLAERPVRANSLIITVYGDMIAVHGGTVWLGSFIRLVQPLGLNERMVRTSVFRLIKEKWLIAEQSGRRSYYSLTALGRRRFEHAYRRIYDAPQSDWNGEWQLVLTGGALPPGQRDALRKELLWDGFGNIAPGVLAHPSPNTDTLMEILEDCDARDKVVVMQARALATAAGKALQQLVHECWGLATIAADYERFIERFRPLLRAMRNARALDPQHCFVLRTLLMHEFRRVQLRDPQLPQQLLSARWPGHTARALCRDIYVLTQAGAARHLMAVLETAQGPLPEAAPHFYTRFGGLG